MVCSVAYCHNGIFALMCLDWIEAAEVLKKNCHNSAQIDVDRSADEGNISNVLCKKFSILWNLLVCVLTKRVEL